MTSHEDDRYRAECEVHQAARRAMLRHLAPGLVWIAIQFVVSCAVAVVAVWGAAMLMTSLPWPAGRWILLGLLGSSGYAVYEAWWTFRRHRRARRLWEADPEQFRAQLPSAVERELTPTARQIIGWVVVDAPLCGLAAYAVTRGGPSWIGWVAYPAAVVVAVADLFRARVFAGRVRSVLRLVFAQGEKPTPEV